MPCKWSFFLVDEAPWLEDEIEKEPLNHSGLPSFLRLTMCVCGANHQQKGNDVDLLYEFSIILYFHNKIKKENFLKHDSIKYIKCLCLGIFICKCLCKGICICKYLCKGLYIQKWLPLYRLHKVHQIMKIKNKKNSYLLNWKEIHK